MGWVWPTGDGRAMLWPLKHPPLNCLGRHLFMDSGPSTLHLIILADPNTLLQKALILYKHAVCDTTQPISNAPGSHSRGCGYLLQACAQTCSSAPVSLGSVGVCFSKGAGMDQTPLVLTGVALDFSMLTDLSLLASSRSRLWNLVMAKFTTDHSWAFNMVF